MKSQKKNKVTLSDYKCQRDIDTRLLLSDLSTQEVETLREILNNSLKIPLKQFLETLTISKSELLAILEKYKPTKLIKIESDTIVVDKEMRKYFESQIVKFDANFEPGMEFLQGLLNKVPIHHLPQWYAIPRTTDNIFQSILERFLLTPKIYERYLQEILNENPLWEKIAAEVFKAPDFTVSAKSILQKYGLTHPQFEELTLLLEYNFICCLRYKEVEGRWEEILTPFHEWNDYLRFKRDTTPKSIEDPSKIILHHPTEEFGFVKDMSNLLTLALKKPVNVDSLAEIGAFLPTISSTDYLHSILEKIQFLHFGEVRDHKLHVNEKVREWLNKPIQERALTFSRHPIKVEKSLKGMVDSGWIYANALVEGFTGAINGKEPTTLKQKGKRWKYVVPSYNEEEKELIKRTLCDRLFEAGFVSLGTHAGMTCLKVTPFGRSVLEE